jgi:hypothetical protein
VAQRPGTALTQRRGWVLRPEAVSAWPLTRFRRAVAFRGLVASGSRLVAPSCFVGLEQLLVSTPLYLRNDLEEQDHDHTGPECVTERVQQVAHKAKGSVVTDDLSA